MELLKNIKKSTGLKDLISAKLTLDMVYDRKTVEKKALTIANISNAALAGYSCNGRHLDLVLSTSLKKHFESLTPGTKVRFEVKTEDGHVLEDMTKHGKISQGASIFYMSCQPCIMVDFEQGPEAYDAIGLIVED